jgi:hypothetical protein
MGAKEEGSMTLPNASGGLKSCACQSQQKKGMSFFELSLNK